LRGESGAATLPVITFSNNGVAFQMRGAVWTLQDFEIRNSNATKTASLAIQGASGGGMTTVRRMVISHATNKFWKAIGASGGTGWTIEDCDIGNCASNGIDMTNTSNKIMDNWIHDCGGNGILDSSTTDIQALVYNNLIETNTGDGINVTATGATAAGGGMCLLNNTIANNTGDGIEFTLDPGTTDRPLGQAVFRNNIFASNGGFGINLSGSGWTDAIAQVGLQIDVSYNAFFGNSGGAKSAFLTLNSTNQTALDPTFTDSANANYSIGTNLKAKGYSAGTRNIGANRSLTVSYMDPGASQRNEDSDFGYLPVA